ncbi:MAG: TlyA family rRNA (cytidine-2'-O)-methyltransferase, partial [Clostridia bacterium]|nr:TlyA family rRNA (cytidine-2'-O)-methyltransferase [Clostridia bacterium]
MRIDLFLIQSGYFESRNKAAAAVKEGLFSVNGKQVFKPSFEVAQADRVVQLQNKKIYVARSAHKLIQAFKVFDLNWSEKTIADLGASTGGFCQVMLEMDVKRIYAVDIGTAQLHPSLKDDPRIVNLEHT